MLNLTIRYACYSLSTLATVGFATNEPTSLDMTYAVVPNWNHAANEPLCHAERSEASRRITLRFHGDVSLRST